MRAKDPLSSQGIPYQEGSKLPRRWENYSKSSSSAGKQFPSGISGLNINLL